jgi:excisionase family DNA binding protein
MAQAFAVNQATPAAGSAPAPAAAPAVGIPELLSPADVAKALGVTEADVLSSLADGSLKGKRIGATWRITRSALDEFLKS